MTVGVNLRGIGLEIGPSHSPMVPKREGYQVEILDHADADALRTKYKALGIPDDKLDNIEQVDYIWSGEPLHDLTGKRDHFDYIIASHVVEHTPDLVSFLWQCETMLKDGGLLSLAVPDKRFCFDVLRPITSTGNVLQAYYEKRTRHTPGTIFDHFSMAAFRNGCHAWNADDTSPLEFVHDLVHAKAMDELSRSSPEYIDVHGWVFVPQSFRLIVSDLKEIGLIDLVEERMSGTHGFEFYVLLKKAKHNKPLDRMSLAVEVLGWS
jgi:SAM-dependent methyltransferase